MSTHSTPLKMVLVVVILLVCLYFVSQCFYKITVKPVKYHPRIITTLTEYNCQWRQAPDKIRFVVETVQF